MISYPKKQVILLCTSLFLGAGISLSLDDLSISGSNELQFTVSQKEQTDSMERYFEDWTDLSIY